MNTTQCLSAPASSDAVFAEAHSYLQGMSQSIQKAWESWEELGNLAPGLRVPLKTRTRASFINDHICRNIEEAFRDDDKIKIVKPKRGFLMFTIPSLALVFRFKKFNNKLLPSNIKTEQQVNWALQLSFEGEGFSITKLNMGYTVNEVAAGLARIYVACQHGRSNLWATEVAKSQTVEVEIVRLDLEAPAAVVQIRQESLMETKTAISTNDGN